MWDTLLIERIDPDAESYANKPDATLTASDISTFEQGTVDDWALETHAVAVKVAYDALPSTEPLDIGTDYFQTAAPAVDCSFRKWESY